MKAFDPPHIVLSQMKNEGWVRVARIPLRRGWPVRLAVRAAKRASRALGGDGCERPDFVSAGGALAAEWWLESPGDEGARA